MMRMADGIKKIKTIDHIPADAAGTTKCGVVSVMGTMAETLFSVLLSDLAAETKYKKFPFAV